MGGGGGEGDMLVDTGSAVVLVHCRMLKKQKLISNWECSVHQ